MDAMDVTDEDVYCDKTRLNQVLLNLLSNAIKFTPAGGPVSVRVRQLAGTVRGCGQYEFRIKDTGCLLYTSGIWLGRVQLSLGERQGVSDYG